MRIDVRGNGVRGEEVKEEIIEKKLAVDMGA